MLIGEFQHNIDTKGRIIMPAKFRSDLGERFIVTIGMDGCLFGFPLTSWEVIQEKLKELPIARKDARKFTRYFYSAATEVEFDKQGRINLPKSLVEYAKIDKECRVIGVSDRIEIWSSSQWEAFAADAKENFEDLAEEMINFGF